MKEEKQSKTLKAFYTVSDSDDNEEKRRKLNQLDGNGDCVVLSAESVSVGSSVEECGDKISLAPPSLPWSYVTYSDTADSLNRTIADTLSDLFGNRNESNTNSNAESSDSNVEASDSHDDKIEIKVEDSENNDDEGDKLYCCSECPEKLFTSDGLSCHYRHAHISGSSDTEHKSSSDEVVLLPSSSSDIEIVLEVKINKNLNVNRKLMKNWKLKVQKRKQRTVTVKRKLMKLKVHTKRKLKTIVSLNKNLNVNRKLMKLKV